MTPDEASIIVGNIPIDGQDECYDITEYQQAKAMAIEALGLMQKYTWTLTKDKMPEKDGKYLCVKQFHNHYIKDVILYSNDLYKIDSYDFEDKKGIAGFYDYDSEAGFFTRDVLAWMPLPEYKEGQ